MSGRSVPEWIGKTPDSVPPLSVKLRVFRHYGGVCAISGRKIRPGDDWDADHAKELWEGGENRETNLRPVLKAAHRQKSAEATTRRAKADRVAKKHLGLAKAKRPLPGSKASGWKAKIGGGWEKRT